jgi:hypothetical protein
MSAGALIGCACSCACRCEGTMGHRLLIVMLSGLGFVAAAGPAQAVIPAAAERAVAGHACPSSACVQQVQMMDSLLGRRPPSEVMPADQRALLDRLLSRELEGVVMAEERQLLAEVRDRNQRLAREAVRGLSLLLREKEEQVAQQELEAAAAAEAQAKAEQEAAAAAAQAKAEQEAAAAAAQAKAEQEAAAAAAARPEEERTELAQAEEEQQQPAASSVRETRQEAAVAEQDVELLFYDFPPLRPL